MSLARPGEVVQALRAPDAEGVAVVRGGGRGLETFDNLELAEAALELNVPLVTAIGHAEDRTLFERMSDRGFTTPTAFGTFRRDLAQGVHAQTERARLVKDLREELVREREAREQQVKRLAQQKRIAWSVVSLLLLTLMFLLLR